MKSCAFMLVLTSALILRTVAVGYSASFEISSPKIQKNGLLPAEFTCDGASSSPPVNWTNVPENAQSLALILWHDAPDNVKKFYWIVYNMPTTAKGIPQNDYKKIGLVGLNEKTKTNEYEPMCSSGPGEKTYNITVYALSQELKVKPNEATYDAIQEAMKGLIITQDIITFKYKRPEGKDRGDKSGAKERR